MYDIKNMAGLQRMAHALHMHEMWESARPQFAVLEDHPANRSLCHCAVNTESNGVIENLRLNALKIREPESFYKPHPNSDKHSKAGYDVSYVVSYSKALSLDPRKTE